MTKVHPELTGDEKLAILRKRIDAFRLGADVFTIECPYCGSVQDFSDEMKPPADCCMKFGVAAMAIIGREIVEEQSAFANKIADAWADMQAKGLVN